MVRTQESRSTEGKMNETWTVEEAVDRKTGI